MANGKVEACGICGGNLRPFLDLGFQPLAERFDTQDTYPLNLVRCELCSLVQLDYIVDQKTLFPQHHPYATGNSMALAEHYRDLAHDIDRRFGVAMGRLAIDIGANDGTLVEEMARRGYTALGVEPTGQIETLLTRGPGLSMDGVQAFFTLPLARQLRKECGPARIITANNVLAHVPGPHDFMLGVTELMNADSVFITENHDLASITDGLQYDTVYHEHLRYYSLASLSHLMAMHGLEIFSVERTDMHGGSFRVCARLEARNVQARATTEAEALHKLLSRITDAGGVVYGVGATTRATPLIHYARL